jgi:hypothetical protein
MRRRYWVGEIDSTRVDAGVRFLYHSNADVVAVYCRRPVFIAVVVCCVQTFLEACRSSLPAGCLPELPLKGSSLDLLQYRRGMSSILPLKGSGLDY